ncbi:uncharacterized protein EDB91DRAFT_676274 [Suillus paluster]|uniref:uncharacterized protein n=1 Tax=Suillus paluster TaxID=48578 RepID=UPI001B864908|nr:uncharacterized protein EDB91DRAFT_676274 [Suillus paluster]KAG1732183.1 hypothetical protein EDB91DRAFT_676274 [Suillus paluster]
MNLPESLPSRTVSPHHYVSSSSFPRLPEPELTGTTVNPATSLPYRTVSPLPSASSASPRTPPSQWSLPTVDNPYGSDLVAGAMTGGGDDDDDEEDSTRELEHEFMPWNDEDMPDGEQAETSHTVDAGTSGTTSDGRTPGQPRSSMPTWLKNDYLRVWDWLIHEMKHNSSRMPTCYDRYSFYDGAENCFLAARASYDGSAAGIFHQPRYFLWLPHLLVDRIPCPACKEAKQEGSKTSVVYLQKHGFVDSP